MFAASSGRIGADFLHFIGVDFAKKEEDCKKLSRTLQTAFPAFWLLVILIWSQTPFFFVLLGQNSNSILLLPIAYGVLYLAMRETEDRRMSPIVGLALIVTVLAITIFTFVNLYHSWTS